MAWVQARSEATLLVYIDNFEIISDDVDEIHRATSLALRFFEAWAFRIDRDKSWSWTTTDPNKHRNAQTFEIRAAKLNLGCFQCYRKLTRRGHLADRLKEGARRAHCIAALPFDTQARIQAILAGPMQVAFYGSEISYIGEKSIKSLRSATSKVLACSNHGTNHKVALHTYQGGICDPKIQIVLRAIRAARRAFWKFPEQYASFISLMCANQGHCRKAWGPAGTLASYFCSLDINIDADGFIALPEQDMHAHLFRSGFITVSNLVLRAWTHIIQKDLAKRKHLHDVPEIDPVLTGHFIDKLEANEARTIRTFLSGGFPTDEIARHWINTDEHCRVCGQVDTLAHRLQSCDATATTRQQHPVLQEVDQFRAEAPWARSTTAGRNLLKCWDSLALPCISLTFDDSLPGRIIYTDGTCDHPKDILLAQAAWSVVADPCPGTRHHQAMHNHLDQHIREMRVIECGRPQGQQSIGRAELLAIAVAIARVRNIRVVSDCKGAIDITQSLLAGRGIHHYANHPNFDIVHLLHRAIHKWPVGARDIHLEKIKSHQQGPFSLEDVRKVAGNEAADYAARNVLAETPSNLRSLVHEARALRTDEKKLMPALLQGATDAVVTYLQAIRALSSTERLQRTRPALQVDAGVVFLDTNPFFQLPVDDTSRQRACWGVTFTLAAMRWLLLLKWPKDECAEGQVTWIELLLSFKEQTGLAIPAPHPTVHGVYHSPGVHSVLHYEEKSLGSESWSFNNFLRSLRTITEQEVMPWHRTTSAVGTTP